MSEIEGFAERIFLLRRSANKKQEDVGAVLGLTKSGISSFEKGKSVPSPENLVKLAVLFGVTVDYLLTGFDSLKDIYVRENGVLSNSSAVHSTSSGTEQRKAAESNDYTPIEELNRYFGAVEDALNKSRALFEQVLAESEVSQLTVGARHDEQDKNEGSTIPHTTLPEFDQAQIDRRFLTELDRLLKAKAFLTYTAWAQAIDVSPSYVAAIERGRYHFNIELLYRTVRRFPDFDFTYVLFGSALTARPEPTELPRRGRGRPKETDFRERLKKIITSYNLDEHGMWPGDHNDLANDKKVYKLYTEEYGPIEDNAKYLHEISLVIDNLINEIKNGSDKE